MADMLDKYRGSLVGGAVGDALGYAVEFCSERQIFSEYGENGITEYALKNGKAPLLTAIISVYQTLLLTKDLISFS